MSLAHILVVDDEVSILTALQKALTLEGYSVDVAGGVKVAGERLARRSYDLVLLDVALPDGDGVSLLESIRASGNDVPAVMMSGHATVDAAVRATRLGAMDFLEKPISTDRLLLVIQNTLRLMQAEAETRELRKASGRFGELVGSSRAMDTLREQSRARLAPRPACFCSESAARARSWWRGRSTTVPRERAQRSRS